MKMTIKSRSEEQLEEYDYKDCCTIEIDGEKVFHVSDGEPEDANLSRDFNDVWNIPDILKRVYEAGKKGEILTIEQADADE